MTTIWGAKSQLNIGEFFAFFPHKLQYGVANFWTKKGVPAPGTPDGMASISADPEPSPTDRRKRHPLGAGIHAAELG